MFSFWNRRYVEGYSHVYGRFAYVPYHGHGHLYFWAVPALETCTIDKDAVERVLDEMVKKYAKPRSEGLPVGTTLQ